MSKRPLLHPMVPSILDLCTSRTPQTCIDWASRKHRRCSKRMKELAKQQANNLWHDINAIIPQWDQIKKKLLELAKVLYCRFHRERGTFKTSLERIVKVWCTELRNDYYEKLKVQGHSRPENEVMATCGSSTTKRHCPEDSVSMTSSETTERCHDGEPLGTRKITVLHSSAPRASLSSTPHFSTDSFFPPRTTGTSTLHLPTRSTSPARPAEIPSAQDFIPYRSPPKGKLSDLFSANSSCPDRLRDILLKNIEKFTSQGSTSREWGDGYIYVFVRSSSPQPVKIGYTNKSVRGRIEQWGTPCGYSPLLKYQTRKIPWAARLEKIVHAHLHYQRKTQIQCSCRNNHHEWFHIGVEEAIRVVERWERWILDNPYIDHQTQDNTKRLHTDWSDRLSSSFSNQIEDEALYPWHDAATFLRREILSDFPSSPPSPSPSPRHSSGHTRHQHSNSNSLSLPGTRTIESYFSPMSSLRSRSTISPTPTSPSTSVTPTTLQPPLAHFRGGRRISLSALPPTPPTLRTSTALNSEEDSKASPRRSASSIHSTSDTCPPKVPSSKQASPSSFPKVPLSITCLVILFVYVKLSRFLLEWCV